MTKIVYDIGVDSTSYKEGVLMRNLLRYKKLLIFTLIFLIGMFAFFSYVYVIYNSHKEDLKASYDLTVNFINDLFRNDYNTTYEYLSQKSKQQLSKQQWKNEVFEINNMFKLLEILEPKSYNDIQYKINLTQKPKNFYIANAIVLSKNNNNQKVTRLIKITLVPEQNHIVIDNLLIETESNQLKCYIP
ncbi:hypothetical protein SAMN02745195_00375 [Thermoanaerobacter uzonensis DSM 18761]|jgi:hypothetical protein|uniref:Uncharacterized protein n=2 Tax=Thermoanaerobacter uzonensis TaxID=447593 RepID=A0A1M4TIH2_9THEO|nr:hypothetical protein SAMN02745195_00375 [Thermoanaerobacter uzonensis DSM 18761]